MDSIDKDSALPSLLLVRIPPLYAAALARNVHVTSRWRVLLLDTSPADPIQGIADRYCVPWSSDGKGVAECTAEILRIRRVTHAVVLTPISKYGIAAWATLADAGVNILWSEVFPGGKLLLDRLGCQYTGRNEITLYEDRVAPLDPELPIGTRWTQPPPQCAEELWKAYGREAIVVFGQVPHDHSLLEQDGPSYLEWLDIIFSANPGTTFLFKQHPASESLEMARTPGLEKYPNVLQINASVDSLFLAYRTYAAYGSTTILEGVSRSLSFATCGRHFVDVDGLVLRIKTPEGASDLLGKLKAFRPDPALLRRRLQFLTRYYAMHPEDPRFEARISLTSDDFFIANHPKQGTIL